MCIINLSKKYKIYIKRENNHNYSKICTQLTQKKLNFKSKKGELKSVSN